jgi:hypothetical protein
MINKLKKLFGMNKEKMQTLEEANGEAIREDFKVYEEQMKAQEEAEAAADNIDSVPEPEEELTQFQPTATELQELNDQGYIEDSTEVVGFVNREAQYGIYAVVRNIIPENSSILDFGCGRGDFYMWHKTTFGPDTKIDYLGVDANSVLIDAGKKLYEGIELTNSDWNALSKDIKYDWCVNIGSNNMRYDFNAKKTDDEYLFETIDRMYEHANKGVLLQLNSSALVIDQDQEDSGIVRFNPGVILNYAQTKYGNVALDHTGTNELFYLIIYKN